MSTDWSAIYRGDCPLCSHPLSPILEYVVCDNCTFSMEAYKYYAKVKKDRIGHHLVKHRHITEDDVVDHALG